MKNKGLEDSWMYDMCHHLLVGTDDEAKANMLIDTYHFLKKKKFKELLRFIFIVFAVVVIVSAFVVLIIYIGIPHSIRVVLDFVLGVAGGTFVSIEYNGYTSMVDFINQKIEETEKEFDLLIRKVYQKDQYDKYNLFYSGLGSINTKTEKGN